MPESPQDYRIKDGRDGPSIEHQQRLLAAIAEHPGIEEAESHVHCAKWITIETIDWLDGTNLSDDDKSNVKSKLGNCDSIALVSYMTSATKPEPLAGGGVTFDYILHPESCELLYYGNGHWRS